MTAKLTPYAFSQLHKQIKTYKITGVDFAAGVSFKWPQSAYLHIPSSDGCIYEDNEQGRARLARNAALGNPRSQEAWREYVLRRMHGDS